MRFLKESTSLCRGIFWVKDVNDIENSFLYFTVECNPNGEVYDNTGLNSKSGLSFNHKVTWSLLQPFLTDNKPFDYYPRGRVEIAHGKATIYCSKHIAYQELIDVCIDKFNLTAHNGINKIRLIVDGSDHYKCYLDRI